MCHSAIVRFTGCSYGDRQNLLCLWRVFESVRGLRAALLLGTAALAFAGVSEKLAAIESGRVPRGGRVTFTLPEINTFAREEAAAYAPQGVRNVQIRLGQGTVTGLADVDFLKLQTAATGQQPGWMARNLFAGERPVEATVRISSRAGEARVDVDHVEISGVPVEGPVLDYVIANYVLALFPDARVGEWFPLAYGADRVTVSPSGVTTVMKQ